MLACVSFDLEFIAILLMPLGICYLCSMYDVLLMICDKQKNFYATVIRNIIVLAVSIIYLSLLGTFDPTLIKMCSIPILVSIVAISSHYIREFEPAR